MSYHSGRELRSCKSKIASQAGHGSIDFRAARGSSAKHMFVPMYSSVVLQKYA